MKPKSGHGDAEDSVVLITSVSPRLSMRATPLAPRPSDVDEIEYETLQRISEMTRLKSDPLAVGGRSAVLGYVWADSAGTVTQCGEACDGPFADRVQYFRELARLVGVELGFETLMELHMSSDKHRIVWTSRDDGGWAAALTTPAERPAELARRLRGEK